MDGITVFTPAPGQPRYQMSVDCLELIRGIVKQAAKEQIRQIQTAVNEQFAEQIDDTAKEVAREILRDVEDIDAIGRLDSASEICDFLRDYYELNE